MEGADGADREEETGAGEDAAGAEATAGRSPLGWEAGAARRARAGAIGACAVRTRPRRDPVTAGRAGRRRSAIGGE